MDLRKSVLQKRNLFILEDRFLKGRDLSCNLKNLFLLLEGFGYFGDALKGLVLQMGGPFVTKKGREFLLES